MDYPKGSRTPSPIEPDFDDSTASFCADPVMRETRLDGLHTPLEDCVPENEIAW